ncbi:hypothetical protein BJV82DRAFT_582678 [Fennellomyces sp. T-0311]|nr:hypothetical protein BJV82DRAFT_582678 [Fennellomyces sp. T-0311]
MEDEANDKPLYKAKVRAYRAQVASLKQPDDNGRRQRLLNNHAKLQASSQRLEESHRIALESQAMGADILNSLRSQRETLTRTRDTVSEADSNIDGASKTLKNMSRWFNFF